MHTSLLSRTFMDKVGGWSDEKQIGPKFAACMRIDSKLCTKECRGVNRLDLDFAGIIGESAIWVTEICLWEHESGSRTPTLPWRKEDFGSIKSWNWSALPTPVGTSVALSTHRFQSLAFIPWPLSSKNQFHPKTILMWEQQQTRRAGGGKHNIVRVCEGVAGRRPAMLHMKVCWRSKGGPAMLHMKVCWMSKGGSLGV